MDLHELPITTSPPKVDPSCAYADVVRIQEFDKTYKLYVTPFRPGLERYMVSLIS